MPEPEKIIDRRIDLLARELLSFYDELTALNARSTFVMQALASALADGGELDERSATGAVFCAQGLNDRAAELENQFKKILSQVHASTRTGVS